MTEEEVTKLREEVYAEACRRPSDINEHLPTLRRLAGECSHVTEMGCRHAVSTAALLAAQPATLISWDIAPRSIISQNVMDLLLMSGDTSFQPRVGDTTKIFIETTDMLFIDTLHTFKQLQTELRRHAAVDHFTGKCLCKVKKYLVFHDTITFGLKGEDGKSPGLRTAIHDFQMNNFPIWAVAEDHHHNNGLTVLRHA